MDEAVLEDYYKKRAKEYENIYQKPERLKYIQEYQDYIENVFTGRNVLEIACGTGFWTEIISKSAKSISATDINNEVVEIAKNKVYRNCKPEFYLLNYHEYKKNVEFNGIFVGFLISHIDRSMIDDFLKMIIDNSMIGSKIMFMDNIYVEGESTDISRIDEKSNTYQIRKLSDDKKYEILKNFYSKDQIENYINRYSQKYEYRENKYFWSIVIEKISAS